MRILAIDTAASFCAACVYDTQAGELGRSVLDLGKGHAEHLMGVIDAALVNAGIAMDGLDAIAVSVGPGSFTGVRVGVATARGLALALGKPATGITTLEALALAARDADGQRPTLVVIEAGRGQAYVAEFAADGGQTRAPLVLSLEETDHLVADVDIQTLVVRGRSTSDILTYARLAADKFAANPAAVQERPKPLYLRDADAKPQEDFALPRKTGA